MTLVDVFWRRWRQEYLLELRSAHVTAQRKESSIKEGDIVGEGSATDVEAGLACRNVSWMGQPSMSMQDFSAGKKIAETTSPDPLSA